ncbi:Biotin transporter [Candidatus Hydrogenisulfobacillus filiaventi]|uniref:Biotin transporter n=1 Tax=Candidatus Hydrogenisulfobacillus filiaventi TaxID=2707344 RepID=A0A6F8ZHC4_9FIRM|nr:biotin transporter BioY [Bacillota bacterium]CAB1129186.1 Biotin transporter [Candidatus Hydrogenisulfobacillus filiaventi]
MATDTTTTLADLVWPRRGAWSATLEVVAASLFLALAAQVAIRLPFTPVPVTGQTFGVLLTGSLLGSRRGTAAVLLYLLEAGAGLPFLAAGGTGWPWTLGPLGGYLVGFVLMVWLVGRLSERRWDRRFRTSVLVMLAGEAAVYAVGVPWLAFYVGGLGKALVLGLLPFLPGDALKLLLAAGLLPAGWRWLGRRPRRR